MRAEIAELRALLAERCVEHGIGEFNPAADVYLVSKRRLRDYLLREFPADKLPHALRVA